MQFSNKIVQYILIVMLILPIPVVASVQGIGIGGGGALGGISFDPYHPNHVFIGSDMGLVYESSNLGETWNPISQENISFGTNIAHSSHMGFSKPGLLYWASKGCDPKVSQDQGVTWTTLDNLASLLPKNCPYQDVTRIEYWFFSDDNPLFIGVGTTNGLWISPDAGVSWSQYFLNQDSFASLSLTKNSLVHASSQGMFKLDLSSGQITTLLNEPLLSASMGKDQQGLTLVGVEKTDNPIKKVFIKKPHSDSFQPQSLDVGHFIRMSPNNSSIVYYTGNESQDQGSSIWFSQDSGSSWSLRFTNDDDASKNDQLNPNPVGLYVGYWDSSYQDVQVSPFDPNVIAVSGNFFFKLSSNAGVKWVFPYSKLQSPTDHITKADFWTSTQLNEVSVFFIKRHPNHHNMIVAGLADIGCVLSLDNGKSWRMCNIPNINTTYDIAFNPDEPNQLYAAASSMHDYPMDWYSDILNFAKGGIFRSDDAGITWTRISPDEQEYINPYLSVAIDFKTQPCQIYAGTQGRGIISSDDCGIHWTRLNQGFEPMESSQNSIEKKGALIIPHIKISPITGDVYAIHAGNRFWDDEKNPYLHFTGLYILNKKLKSWEQLGRPPMIKAPGSGGLYWKYPLDFTIDWNNPNHIYLTDMATAGTWEIGGVWYTSDQGQHWNQVLQLNQPRRVIIKDGITYIVGWSDPGEPFIFKSLGDNHFNPMNIRIPLQVVNDAIIDDDDFLFGTFGGGIFKVTNEQKP